MARVDTMELYFLQENKKYYGKYFLALVFYSNDMNKRIIQIMIPFKLLNSFAFSHFNTTELWNAFC
jgi:hypothetical protein